MSILNAILRKRPKYCLQLKGTSVYVSEKNQMPTSDSITTKSIYNAKDYTTWKQVQKVLDTIDVDRERYFVRVG